MRAGLHRMPKAAGSIPVPAQAGWSSGSSSAICVPPRNLSAPLSRMQGRLHRNPWVAGSNPAPRQRVAQPGRAVRKTVFPFLVAIHFPTTFRECGKDYTGRWFESNPAPAGSSDGRAVITDLSKLCRGSLPTRFNTANARGTTSLIRTRSPVRVRPGPPNTAPVAQWIEQVNTFHRSLSPFSNFIVNAVKTPS
jgi:hypothetical protein